MRIERTLGLVALAAFLPLMAMERANAVDWTPPSLTSGSFVDSIAETAQYFGVSEVRLGPAITNLELIPDRWVGDPSSFNKGRLEGVEFDVLFNTPFPETLKWIGSPRPSIGGVVNLGGHESMIHAGLDWHLAIGSTPFHLEGGVGVATHNAYLNDAPPGFHDVGCPILLHWKHGIGVNLNDNTTFTADWAHISGAPFGCNPNQGLNDVGFTVGHKF